MWNIVTLNCRGIQALTQDIYKRYLNDINKTSKDKSKDIFQIYIMF